MRRRSGFTLVELLVAMALILFIMSILAASFGAATQSLSDLKSAADLDARLSGASAVIHRDLEAQHTFDAANNAQRLSTMWDTNNGPNPPPPDKGYFRFYERSPAVPEGTDINGLPSYYQTGASFAYTIALTGMRRNDFLSAFVGAGSPLVNNAADPVLGPPDQRYQDTGGVYNTPSAEVALFLLPTPDVTDASGSGGAQPLYGLYRRQLLTVPTQPTPLMHWSPAAPVGVGQVANYVEVSTMPTAGEVPISPNLSFNSLADLTFPPKRFWMDRINMSGLYQPVPAPAAPNTFRYAALGEVNAGYQAADLLMPDVVSMDVRVLVRTVDPSGVIRQAPDFEDLYDITNPNRPDPLNAALKWYFPYNNPYFTQTGAANPRVFDTWASGIDPNNPTYNYTTWQTPFTPASIPIYKDNYGNPISIRAIQITLRVWDFKTKKTRQVTLVQQM